jgi:hypothetical protein
MVGSTGKRYGEEFKLMILEMQVLCQLGGSKSNSKHYEIRN